MKKTSPKKLHPMAQTNKQTNGHGDSMTDPAQRAESVKIPNLDKVVELVGRGSVINGAYPV